MKKPDVRLNAYRPDLADIRLKGRVEAARFVEGEISTIIEPRVALRSTPDLTAGYTTEALLGDRVRVYERQDGWAWGTDGKRRLCGLSTLCCAR